MPDHGRVLRVVAVPDRDQVAGPLDHDGRTFGLSQSGMWGRCIESSAGSTARSDYAATLRSAATTLASIKATGRVSIGSGSIWSAMASVEKPVSALFAALRVFLAFLVFLGWFRVEAFGFLPTLTATIPLAAALTTLPRPPPSSRDSLDS
jgi:hypothetical protein